MKPIKILFILSMAFVIASCSSSKTLRFTKRPDDVVKTESLQEFLKSNKNPKVVLRVTNTSYTVTEGEDINYVFNAIENHYFPVGLL